MLCYVIRVARIFVAGGTHRYSVMRFGIHGVDSGPLPIKYFQLFRLEMVYYSAFYV